MSRDADDKRCKQQWRNDRSNEADEDGAEDAELSGGVGKKIAERAADNDGDQNPGCQRWPALWVRMLNPKLISFAQ